MTAILKKLLNDLWKTKGKFLLCIIAATISAWGIGSVVYSYYMSERDFRENFANTNAADFVINLKKPGDTLLQKLSSYKGIKNLERREAIGGRIKGAKGNWMPLLLFGVADLDKTQISKFRVLEKFKAKDPSVYIESNALKLLPPPTTALTIQIAGIVNTQIPWGGLVHDPGLPPSQMEGAAYGYTSIENFDSLIKNENQRFLVKTTLVQPDDEDLKSFANSFKKYIENNSGSVISVAIPAPGEHPHQNIVNGISFLQKSFGIILSVLGVILLSLILLTWLYSQITGVGVMKALGASTESILGGYIAVLLIIICTGLLIGLPLGYETAKIYNRLIAMVQNFNVVKAPLPFAIHATALLPAILLPFVVALVPLVKTANTTVQASLTRIFYTPHKKVFRLTQRLFQSTRTKYAVNNFFRSSQRTWLMMFLLILGIGLYLGGLNLKYSVSSDFARYARVSYYDISVGLKDSMQAPLTFIEDLPYVQEVSYVNQKNVQFISLRTGVLKNSSVKIVNPGHVINDELLLKGSIDTKCSNCFYITQRERDDFEDVKLNSIVKLDLGEGLKPYKYSGVIKELGHVSPLYVYNNQKNESYKTVEIKIKEGVDLAKATQQLDDAFLENDIDVAQIFNKSSLALMMNNHLKPTYLIIQATGIFTIIVALLGMLIVLNLSLLERTREMGIIKALGGSVQSVKKLYRTEYITINLMASTLGLAVGLVFTYLMCKVLGRIILDVEISAFFDIATVVFSIIALLALQILLVMLYVGWKVKKTSASMLSNIF